MEATVKTDVTREAGGARSQRALSTVVKGLDFISVVTDATEGF